MTTHSIIGCPEPFSALSHFAGAIVCLISGSLLIRRIRKAPLRCIAAVVFCGGCVLLLVMSGFFHFLPLNSSSRGIFQRLDHAAIFVLIAGTFTPIHLIRFRGFWRWGPLSLIWAVAIVGVVIKTAFFKDMSESISLLTYLSMGWFGIVTAVLLWLESGFLLVRPLLAGAVSYSVGSISEFFKQPVLIDGVIGPHELFHLTVLIGIAFHWHLIRHILTADCKLASSEARVLEENALGV